MGIWWMEEGMILAITEEACVDMLFPETYWPQVNGQTVNCKSDLYPDWDWKCWGFSKTVSYALCVCFPSSTAFLTLFFVLTLSPLIKWWPLSHPDSPLVMQNLFLFLTMGIALPHSIHSVLLLYGIVLKSLLILWLNALDYFKDWEDIILIERNLTKLFA